MKQNRDPKWIRPCCPKLLQLNVSMPYEFYIEFMKWCSLRLKDWWRCQLKRGDVSSDPSELYNLEATPPYLVYCLSWVCGYDARGWNSCGVRWMLWEMYGNLDIERMRYGPTFGKGKKSAATVKGKGSDSAFFEAVSTDSAVDVARMMCSEKGDVDGFFLPSAGILQLCGF